MKRLKYMTNVKEIREKSGKTQSEFAHMIGVSIGTLRNWEQGRRYPEGAALTLLKVVAADSWYVAKVLYGTLLQETKKL